MKGKVAKFRFVEYKIINSSIDITKIDDRKSKLSVEINQKGGEIPETNLFKLEIETKITNNLETLTINVVTVGLFEFNPSLENKDSFFKLNGPAILFPYIRAYISTLTALSGIPPIILPTLNIASMIDKKSDK